MTLLVAIVMPTAIIATFMPMVLADYTLNLMTTLGLAISTGVLVNNSILVIEHHPLQGDGVPPHRSGRRARSTEIAIAVLSTTATNLGSSCPWPCREDAWGRCSTPSP